MDHLSLFELAHLVEYLTATDLVHLSSTCRALQPSEAIVQSAIGLVIKHRFGDVVGFLREDEPQWPRSPLILRCAEVLRVKRILSTAIYSPEDSSSIIPTGVAVSKAWTLAWKKRCQSYEQFVNQFRITKKKQLQRERSKKSKRWTSESDGETVRFSDGEALVTKAASAVITCPHDALLPAAFCVSRAKRAVISRSNFRSLALYAPDIRGFPLYTTSDCLDCVMEKAEDDRETARRKQARFEESIAGSTELVDVLLRKNGYPNELFSPATSRGNTLLSLHQTSTHNQSHTYYLVPKKWMIKWRKYVRSMTNDEPGPILNAELVCHAHQRSIVPAHITMFLSGFSLEVSLQATQALGASASTQYEIVTSSEWDVLFLRYCPEYAVGFDVHSGSYHWKTPECHVCHYGMDHGNGRRERCNPSRS